MYDRILVAFDGSPTSTRGLEEALRIAHDTGATLRLLYLADDLRYATGFEPYAVYANDVLPLMRRDGEQLLQAGSARARDAGVAVDTMMVEGSSLRLADVVAAQARAWHADLIVIGTHGRRGTDRWLLGSDAEQVLRSAPVPVLLVRAQPTAPGASA